MIKFLLVLKVSGAACEAACNFITNIDLRPSIFPTVISSSTTPEHDAAAIAEANITTAIVTANRRLRRRQQLPTTQTNTCYHIKQINLKYLQL